MYDSGEVPTKELLRATAGELLTAMGQGYGSTIISVDYGTPDFETLDKLSSNCFYFSAAKNYHELKDMSLALRDGDRIRSFSEFKKKVVNIDAKYQRWLNTEYNQAVISAQQAARWTDFKKNKDIMPMLRYETVGDNNVRPEHQAFNGITRKIDDGFWNTHYPPNGWGCRCEAIQLTNSKAKETDLIKKYLPAIPLQWSFNVGKSGILFPENHPYYKGIPKDVKENANKALNYNYRKLMEDWVDKNVDNEKLALDNFQKELVITKKSVKKDILKHFGVVSPKDKFLVKELDNILPICKEYKWNEPLQEKANKATKEAEGVLHFNYYSFELDGKSWKLETKVFADFERIYAIVPL